METTTQKITKRTILAQIDEIVEFIVAEEFDLDVDVDAIRNYIENEILLLDKKAAQSKARHDQERAKGDELRDRVYALIKPEVQVLNDLLTALNDNEVSQQKVTARISQLVKMGKVVREEVVIPATASTKARKITGYRLAQLT